jgi:hypothetical protein
MTDFESVARFPSPAYTLKQASSYDRRSISPDRPGWFANADFNQFIREEKVEGHSEFVMMDADGPGVIVRFWLTTLARQGTMRFYFDKEPEASLQIPGFDLMKAGFDVGRSLLIPHSSGHLGGDLYHGNTLSVDNHMSTWYGEGDAKAYVDNETFPSEFGTGLEDYYNTSWAPVVLYQTPFANAPRADHPSSTGYNTFTRTRILDVIPFVKAFSFDMEMLSWDGGTIDAAATTYWYGFAGSTDK